MSTSLYSRGGSLGGIIVHLYRPMTKNIYGVVKIHLDDFIKKIGGSGPDTLVNLYFIYLNKAHLLSHAEGGRHPVTYSTLGWSPI